MKDAQVESLSPVTGAGRGFTVEVTPDDEVDRIASAALAASEAFEGLGRDGRAELLRTVADELELAEEQIVSTAHAETAIPEVRLRGELKRTAFQARFFADVITDGNYLEAAIDHAGDTPMGPGPDLRKMLVPTGPVAVFGASNFPLAFSVPGGDTISAWAAGNPVIVKAHGSHPELSTLTFEILKRSGCRAGAPDGAIGIVYGTSAGAHLVAHHAISAVGFTGSLSGARALMSIIDGREDPIPFYGELSSINPLVVSPGAASTRADEIAQGLVDSFTTSAGQLCTKPGIVFVPTGDDGDNLVAAASHRVAADDRRTLLNQRIAQDYAGYARQIATRTDIALTAEGTDRGDGVPSRLYQASAADFDAAKVEECFGPTTLIVRYSGSELDGALEQLPGSLTATVHSEPGEENFAAEVYRTLRPKAGRLLHNGYPTGVLVAWSQNHGGPWPATNTQYTSVGADAIRRWLRPVTWQDVPQQMLPAELRDDVETVPRRVDGTLQLPQPA